ncbi:zinc finger protein 354A-like isoform X2 [Cydia splendana]|uniref:zinc finger protein 354A-like isoform X2 n=1 Tax=Cydia splendana TaxID=1100963 RepID=UPI00300D6097
MNRTLINSLLQDELLCCRVCLMTDCRLYNIHEYKLADTFTRISGTPVSRDRLPQYLCAHCLTLLLKCSSFRDMCLRTLDVLTPALLKGTLDTDYVRKYQKPHRSLNLTQTELQIVELNPSEDLFHKQILNKHIKEEITINEALEAPDIQEDLIEIKNDDSEQLVLKDEISKIKTETSILETVLVTGKVLNNKKNVKTPKKTNKVLKTVKNLNSKQTKIKVKKTVKTGQVNEGMDIHKNIMETGEENEKMKIKTIEVKNNKTEFNVTGESDDGDGNKDLSSEIEVVAVEPKRRRRMKKHLLDTDLAKFGSSINHTFVTLSKEEQLEEIATRKESQIYLEAPFKCEDCGKGYSDEPAFKNHRVRHSPNMGPRSCDICAVRMHPRCFYSHQVRHRMKFICNECNFVSRDKTQATKHHETHAGKTYKCPHCEKWFIKSTTYLSHVRLIHPELNVDCVDCGETFVSEYGLKQHKNRIHMKSHTFVCTTCSAKFNSVSALNRHTDTAGEHGALRPCEQCGENCASEDKLQEHVGVAHPTESHHCERCDITFSNAAAFDTHKRRKHLGQRYKCPTRKEHRCRIKNRGTAYKPHRTCVCDQCGVTMPNSSLLEYHKRTHLAVKPYACPQCPKTFVMRALLKLHMRSHTGEKPFQCSECPLAFAAKCNLNRHYKVAHLGERESFLCPLCGRTATTRSSLKVHIRAVHGKAGWPKRDRSKREKCTQLDDE